MGKLIFIKGLNRGDKMNKNIACNKANEVREQYGLIGAAIDPLVITKELGIKVLEKSKLTADGKPVSGAIIKEGNEISIYLNAEDSKFRKRFTIAHELGHYYLHLDKTKYFVDLKRSNSLEPEELQADEFAGCLLMNEKEIKSRYKMAESIGLNQEGIINILSTIFAVSTHAVYVRLKNLGVI